MLKIINPATEEEIAALETDDSRSIIEKYNRAMSAQLEWMERPLDDRARAGKRIESLRRHRAGDGKTARAGGGVCPYRCASGSAAS